MSASSETKPLTLEKKCACETKPKVISDEYLCFQCDKPIVPTEEINQVEEVDYAYMGLVEDTYYRFPQRPQEIIDYSSKPEEVWNVNFNRWQLSRDLKCCGCGKHLGEFHYPQGTDFNQAYATNYLGRESYGTFIFQNAVYRELVPCWTEEEYSKDENEEGN